MTVIAKKHYTTFLLKKQVTRAGHLRLISLTLFSFLQQEEPLLHHLLQAPLLSLLS